MERLSLQGRSEPCVVDHSIADHFRPNMTCTPPSQFADHRRKSPASCRSLRRGTAETGAGVKDPRVLPAKRWQVDPDDLRA
jgi:hypothetical protein